MSGKGFVVKAMTVKIGAASYECEVTALKETESHDTVTSRTACPGGTINDVGPSSFTIDVTANVDLHAGSLYALLTTAANYGLAATIVYAPDATNQPTLTRTAPIVLVPAGADFTVGAFATFDVVFPCTAPPTWTTPPTALAEQAEADTAAA